MIGIVRWVRQTWRWVKLYFEREPEGLPVIAKGDPIGKVEDND